MPDEQTDAIAADAAATSANPPDDNPTDAERTITQALAALGPGDRDGAEKLLPLVYNMLRERAGRLMGRERGDHTLTATALVHEAYLRAATSTTAGGRSGRRRR